LGATRSVQETEAHSNGDLPSISPEVWRVTESAEHLTQDQAVSEMRTLVLEITKALVDDPEAVQLEVLPDGGVILLRLQVSPRDLGKVIGKQGRTARSLRTILGAASMKLKHRFTLDIVETGERPA
jgi:predicted RNA-binding protein YlqC (UPF0109 family)